MRNYLFFFATELLFLDLYTLSGKFLGEDDRIANTRVHSARKLFGTVSLVKDVLGKRFQIVQM